MSKKFDVTIDRTWRPAVDAYASAFLAIFDLAMNLNFNLLTSKSK